MGLELGVVLVGLMASLYVRGNGASVGRRPPGRPMTQLPWLLLLVGPAWTVWIFLLRKCAARLLRGNVRRPSIPFTAQSGKM